MIGSILIASIVVMATLGFSLASLVTSRLVDIKVSQAESEIDRVRVALEQQLSLTSTASSLDVRLQSARAALTQLSQDSGESTAAYETILYLDNAAGAPVTSPGYAMVPSGIQEFVSEGQVSVQFGPAARADGTFYDALFIGTPTNADVPGLQLYLVYSTAPERETLALIQGTLATAGGVVVVLLVGIVWLATQQVTRPVKNASKIAQRLAAGHLRERMVVEGEDEIARLAISFNNMADTLSKQITQLEEYGDLQRQFTSDVSHELRTPLTTVRMAADMIAAGSDEFEPHTQRATALMIRELDRFEALLNDLLEISRHDAGVADLSEAVIDVRSPVYTAWEATSHIATELDVEVTFDLPEEPVMITGDTRRIERIMRNLIANALDHSEGNPVEVAMKENDVAVAITVTDCGIGLKPGQEELVFNRFWRADASRKRHSGGTGLGLAIAREDAELHGGILDATGTEGVGSQFRLVLPKNPNEGRAHPEEAPLALVEPEAEETAPEEPDAAESHAGAPSPEATEPDLKENER